MRLIRPIGLMATRLRRGAQAALRAAQSRFARSLLTSLKFPLIPLKPLKSPLKSLKSPLKPLKSLYSAVISRFLHSLRFQVSLAILIVFVPVALILLWSGGRSAAAAWFDELFAYRQALTIGNTGSADANKKVKFDIDTATLITAGKLQSDCDDIRFTDAGGNLLKYFLDSANGACNTISTDLWVLVPTIHSGNTVLYMYYGNPSVGPGTEAAQFSEATFTPTSGPTAASEEKSQGPVSYWKFDEGYGATTQDSMAANNDGTISGATWASSDSCVSSHCLQFDGSDDVTTVTNTTSLDLNDQLAGAFTISGWIRANSDGEGDVGEIAQKGTSTYLRVTKEGSDGLADFEAKLDLATADATISVSNGLNINKWHYVTVVYTDDDDDEITAYIDGVQKGVSTDGSGAPAADTNNLLIGGNTAANFKGFIDDVKIYNYARTAAQIKADYASRGASKGSTLRTQGGTLPDALSNGLVGYWKMEESSGNMSDSSGNGRTLTNNGTITFTAGKFANAGSFNGSTQYGTDHLPQLTEAVTTHSQPGLISLHFPKAIV